MVASVIAVFDEGLDLGFESAGQEAVSQQDAVLELTGRQKRPAP